MGRDNARDPEEEWNVYKHRNGGARCKRETVPRSRPINVDLGGKRRRRKLRILWDGTVQTIRKIRFLLYVSLITSYSSLNR